MINRSTLKLRTSMADRRDNLQQQVETLTDALKESAEARRRDRINLQQNSESISKQLREAISERDKAIAEKDKALLELRQYKQQVSLLDKKIDDNIDKYRKHLKVWATIAIWGVILLIITLID